MCLVKLHGFFSPPLLNKENMSCDVLIPCHGWKLYRLAKTNMTEWGKARVVTSKAATIRHIHLQSSTHTQCDISLCHHKHILPPDRQVGVLKGPRPRRCTQHKDCQHFEKEVSAPELKLRWILTLWRRTFIYISWLGENAGEKLKAQSHRTRMEWLYSASTQVDVVFAWRFNYNAAERQ